MSDRRKKRKLNDFFINLKLPFPPLPDNREYVKIDKPAETISDLLKIIEEYKPGKRKRYGFDLKQLHKLKGILKVFDNIIGVKTVKRKIVEIIIYYLQDLEENFKNKLHTVIIGPPGCGKTMISTLLAKLYCQLGIIKTDKIVIAKRADLIGKYLGQTAPKTQAMIDKAMGGVLLIDEVYQLGNNEGRDIYSKECIDTINQNLTEHQGEFICIIAGYRADVERCFFAYNQGLNSRFTIRINMNEYEAGDLYKIFSKKCLDEGWELDKDVTDEFFAGKKDKFIYNGRDMETLFEYSKITHAKRVFTLPAEEKKIIKIIDVEEAYKLFTENSPHLNSLDKQYEDESIKRLYM